METRPVLTVYGRATSSNVQAVMWGIAELDLPCERLDYGGAFGGTDTPEYRVMNPNGLVPVLRDGAVTMFEGCAILRYLAGALRALPVLARGSGGAGAGRHVGGVGQVDAGARLHGPVFWAVVRTPPSKRDAAAIARALEVVDGHLDDPRGAGRRGPWVMGEDFTLADVVIGHVLYRYFTIEIARPERAGLAAYYARLTGRPGYAEHVMVSYESLRARDA